MAETRRCERCGTEFVPQREHARFCSAACRVAWNRESLSRGGRDEQRDGESWLHGSGDDQAPEGSALRWAIAAMLETTQRLGKVRASDRAQGFAVIGEAVWWVTIVDATLVRYYPDEYEAALDELSDSRRQVTEDTFGGLRFVRNRMGYHADHAEFICPAVGEEGRDGPLTEWTWRSLPVPTVDSLPSRGQQWELSRYRAYQDRLAGRMVGETFALASAFLDLAARDARAAGTDSALAETDGGSGSGEAGAPGLYSL